MKGRAGILPEMALRTEAWLGVKRGGEARLCLAERASYDLWQVEKSARAALKKIRPAEAVAG